MDALNSLRSLGNRLTSMKQWGICKTVLDDERFLLGRASAGHHPGPHQERGGLAIHTWEVAKAAVELAGEDKHLAQLAYVAAVFHDYGKIHEYGVTDGKVVKMPFASRMGHIVWSWAVFIESARLHGMDEVDREEVGHAILAHHGRREWGSPVEPQTRLAHIIHTADMLSARGLV
jgi:3'-5' exoribonuclease